jgi:LacI family transcriptional regulator, galactose operon repressor
MSLKVPEESQNAGRPTMRDVAALAGVGIKTVSRVVNDVPTVAPDLVERVNKAAAKLGYRPNLTASSLRRSDRRTSTIGLLLENVANPFSGVVHRAVEEVARARGVLVLTGSLDEDPVQEKNLARALIDRGADGLLVVPAGSDHSYLVGEQRAGTQIVFLDRNPSLVAADTVRSDHHKGAVGAIAHLIDHGHRRIAYLGDRADVSTARERHAGYLAALRAAGLGVSDELIHQDLSTTEQAEEQTRAILDQPEPPTALFTSQNLVTIGALRALRRAGLRGRIAHVGFDDVVLADVLEPGVTIVAQDPSEIGHLAATMLFARIDGDRSPARTVVVPTRLIARGSGELPPP